MKATILTFAVIVCIAAPLCAAATATEQRAAPDTAAVSEKTVSEETVSEQDVKELAEKYYAQGLQARADGKLQWARTLLRAARRLDPDSAKARNALLTVQQQLKAKAVREGHLRITWINPLDTIIPEVHFENVPLKEVVDYLAREGDINIVFDGTALQLLAAEEPAPPEVIALGPDEPLDTDTEPEALEADDELPPLAPPKATVRPAPVRRDLITIRLKNVPLKEVLKYVLRFKGLKYIVEDYAILIVPIGTVVDSELVTEVFHLTTSGARLQAIRERPSSETSSWGPGGY